MKYWFPHEQIREYQEEIAETVFSSLVNRKHLIFTAPTGIGKTVSVEAAALKFAVENKLKIFYFTNRTSNQILPLKEFKLIKEKFFKEEPIYAGRIVTKKDLCRRKEIDSRDLHSFYRLCQEKKEKECDFYRRLRDKLKNHDHSIFENLVRNNPQPFIDILDIEEDVCNYYLIKEFLDKYATLVVMDYQYVLNPFIRKIFFGKSSQFAESIMVFDECHNLPEKAREAASISISINTLVGATEEIRDYKDRCLAEWEEEKGLGKDLDFSREIVLEIYNQIRQMTDERETIPFSLKDFLVASGKMTEEGLRKTIKTLEKISIVVEEDEKRSRCGAVSNFISMFLDAGDDEKFIKYIESRDFKGKNIINLHIKCLDPSYIFKPIIENSYSVICFSGTLHEKSFKDLLGFPDDTTIKNFPSPFKKEQRLLIVCANEYSSFTLNARNKDVEKKAGELVEIINAMRGNVLVIFPSIDVLNIYFPKMEGKLNKKVFRQHFMDDFILETDYKRKTVELLKKFKSGKSGVLFTIAFGSYNEGVDYKGDLQNAIIVGFPYPSVDYERDCLVEYFDKKFGIKNYGRLLAYVIPGIQKSLQSAGRVIRDKNDRGVIVFYGKQFKRGFWTKGEYFYLFPKEMRDEVFFASDLREAVEKIKSFNY